MSLGFSRSTLETPDGVTLALFVHTPPGWEPSRSPTLFLSNGLGGNLVTWKHLVEHYRATHRIITWDYRGLYDSTFTPALKERYRQGELSVDLPIHAQDAALVLDHLGVERAVFFGWSMGVQLNFELARTQRHRMAGLIQICGAAGKAIATTVFGKAGLSMIPFAMDGFRVAAGAFGPMLAKMVGSPLALQLARGLGVVAPSLDGELAREVVDSYMRQDFEVYNRILMSLAAHDATDVLGGLEVPTLVIAGTRDPMTPMALSERIVSALPNAELVTLEGGSHYVPIEFPERLNELVGRFLAERVRP